MCLIAGIFLVTVVYCLCLEEVILNMVNLFSFYIANCGVVVRYKAVGPTIVLVHKDSKDLCLGLA